MTLREALDRRIPRIRAKHWNPYAFVVLPLEEGGHGLWLKLYDLCSQAALYSCGRREQGEAPSEEEVLRASWTPITILIYEALARDADDWQEWTPPADIARFGPAPAGVLR